MEKKEKISFVPISNEYSEEVEIKMKELEAMKLKDIENLKDKACAKKMGISLDVFEELISCGRRKLATALVECRAINIIDEEIKDEEVITTMCSFRCAVCGNLYSINYLKDKIFCPKCLSTKVMSLEESGFF